MRTKIVAGLTVLALVAAVAIICLMPVKPRAGPWRLTDGSVLSLAAVTDDRGRKVDFHLDHETPSTGGRGATVRQLDKDYYLYLEEDAKSVDVTLAYSRSVAVEFWRSRRG